MIHLRRIFTDENDLNHSSHNAVLKNSRQSLFLLSFPSIININTKLLEPFNPQLFNTQINHPATLRLQHLATIDQLFDSFIPVIQPQIYHSLSFKMSNYRYRSEVPRYKFGDQQREWLKEYCYLATEVKRERTSYAQATYAFNRYWHGWPAITNEQLYVEIFDNHRDDYGNSRRQFFPSRLQRG
jgi:hypothetical protein